MVVGEVAVDGAIIGGSVAVGLLVGGPVGVVAGLGVGLVAVLLDIPKFGEPPKSLLDNAKEGISNALEGFGDFLAKVFW